MLSIRSLAYAAAALLMVASVSADPSADSLAPRAIPVGIVRRQPDVTAKKMLRIRNRLDSRSTPAASLQTVMDTLKSKTGPISEKIQSITLAAPTTPSAETTTSMNAEYSSLEAALNTALAGVTKLLGQVKGDVNLLDLAGTITNVIADLYPALATVEAGLAMDPALAPLITTLAGILNGPLVSIITTLEGLLQGLLPIVNALLAALGLTPLLVGLQGTVGGLLTGLGL
ncbi:hypothetical protein RQP46_008560 [Phenoliferia psychrophenolica]